MAKKSPVIKLVERKVLIKTYHRIYIFGANGKIMLTSEAYFDKPTAKKAGRNLSKATGFLFIDETTLRPVPATKKPVRAKATKKKGSK